MRAVDKHSGFAPCLKEDRPFLAEIMEGVEEIPKEALDGTDVSIANGGMEWSWETMPEFMDVLDSRDLAIDCAAYVPHGALRTYVMGARGADHLSRPTDDDIKAMQMVVKQDGVAGLFKGLGPQLVASVLSSALMMMVKERILNISSRILYLLLTGGKPPAKK